jgi:hypothetical protein
MGPEAAVPVDSDEEEDDDDDGRRDEASEYGLATTPRGERKELVEAERTTGIVGTDPEELEVGGERDE